ncbi:MAG: hypothetical protein AAFQ87_12295, partial [Bacteroidota bacterium]
YEFSASSACNFPRDFLALANRYLDAIDYYEKFVDRYPNSVYLKDAENLFAKAKKSLGKLQAEEAENS